MKIEDPVIREAYNKMHREYQKDRYKNDPDYKKRKLEANSKWLDKNREQWNTFQRERYKNKKEESHAKLE